MSDFSMGGGVDLSSLKRQHEAQAQGAGQAAGEPSGQASVSVRDVVVEGGANELELYAQHSTQVPVLVQVFSNADAESQALAPVLEELVRSAQGRLIMLRIDADAHPELGGQPSVLALVGGRPVPLFQGNPPRDQIVQVVNELLQVAAQQGATGSVEVTGDEASAEPAAKPLPPLHQEAQDAIARGDAVAAKAAFTQQLKEQPGDEEAKVGLAQMDLLVRLQGKSLGEIRDRAAQNPTDVDAQLDVADLDLSGGHVDDSFNRLLDLFPRLDADEKTRVRERLLEFFDVVGPGDERVLRARQRLTSLLFA